MKQTENPTNNTNPEQLPIPAAQIPPATQPQSLPPQPVQVPQAQPPAPPSYFADAASFESGQRVAKLLASSDMVPKHYQNHIANTLLALEIARQMGGSAFFIMQNMYVINGKTSLSAQLIIAVLNTCGRFRGGLRYEMDNNDKPTTCRAWAIDAATGDRVNGPTVSLEMAKAEGWDKNNKWKSMPEVMLRYRAASFFGRLYASDILLGMHSTDEALEMEAAPSGPEATATASASASSAAGIERVNALLEGDNAAA